MSAMKPTAGRYQSQVDRLLVTARRVADRHIFFSNLAAIRGEAEPPIQFEIDVDPPRVRTTKGPKR